MSLERIFLGCGSTFLCLISGYALHEGGYPSTWEPWVVSLCLTWLLLLFACVQSHYGSVYQFSITYIVVLILFHLGITIPDAFGLMGELHLESTTPERWLALAGWCTCLALGAYGLGMALSMGRSARPEGVRQALQPDETERMQLGFECGIALMVISFGLLAWTSVKVGNLLNFSRLDFFNGVGDTRGLGVALMALPSAAILLTICPTTRTQRLIGTAGAILIGLLLLLSGYRTSVLYPLMTGAVLWHKLIGRIPTLLASAAVVLVLLVIPIVGVLRAAGPYKDLNAAVIRESAKSATMAESFRTMGQTGGLLGEVIRLVPAEDPYRHGTTYLESFLHAVPNLGGNIGFSQRESVASSDFLEGSRFAALPPSDWLTYRLAPEKFETGEGLGFTSIGEAYLNFGYTGVLVVFTLLGYLIGRLDGADLKHSSWLLLFTCISFWHLSRTVRDDFTNWVKPSLFLAAMVLAFIAARRMIWRRPGTSA